MEKTTYNFNDEEKQLSQLQHRIEAELPADIYLKLKIYLSDITNNLVNALINPFLNKTEARLALLEVLKNTNNEDTSQKAINDYYKNFDPSPLYNCLKQNLTVNPLIKEYQKFITGLSEIEDVNKVMCHHLVNEEAFKTFQYSLNEVSQPMLTMLRKHTQNLQNYGNAIMHAQERNENNRKERRMTGIMAAVIAGPIPALIARGIASNLTNLDSEQKAIAAAAEKLETDWIEGIEKFVTQFEANLRKRYLLISYVLFGGMLLKINDDIKEYGYEIHDFDWRAMKGSIRLSEKNIEDVSLWMDDSLSKIDGLLEKDDTEGAKLVVEYLSNFLSNKKILSKYEYMPEGVSEALPLLDVMKNKRLNVHLHSINQTLWKEKKYNKAVNSYLDIMTSYETFNTQRALITKVPPPVVFIARIIVITEANQDNIYADHLHYYFYTDSMAYELYSLYRNYRFSESLNNRTLNFIEDISQFYLQTLAEIGLEKDTFYYYLKEKESSGPLVDVDDIKCGLIDKLMNSRFFGGITLNKAIQDNNIAKIKQLIHKSEALETNTVQPPFITAIKHKNNLAFDLMLQKGIDVNFTDRQGNTPLHHAVMAANLKMVSELLHQEDINLNKQNNKGMTAIMFASCQGDIKIVQKLIESGADPAIKDDEDISSMFASIIRGNFSIAELLSPYSDINEVSAYHSNVTMLMYAARINHEEMAKFLLEKGADPSQFDKHGCNILTHSIRGGMNKSFITVLAEYGADLNYTNKETGNSPLIEAVITGNTEAAEILIRSNVNLNIINYEGVTALISAEQNKNYHLRDLLLENGAISL